MPSFSVTVKEQKVDIVEVSQSEVERMLCENHYSEKVTKNVWRSFGIYSGRKLVGAMQIGYGIRPKLKEHIFDGPADMVREFDRMYMTDEMPKNSESAVIGGLIKYLRANYPEVAALITYADGIRGKVGTIYQATNAVYIGEVDGEFYETPSGEYIHPVSLWHKFGTRSRDVLAQKIPGIKHVRGPQHRYVYFVDRKWASKLKVPSLPYPKPGGSCGKIVWQAEGGEAREEASAEPSSEAVDSWV